MASTAGSLAAVGHDVTVIGGDPARMRDELQHADVEYRPAASTGRALRELVRLGSRVDVVHAHMTAAESAAVAANLVNRAPIVVTLHFAARRGRGRWGWAARSVIRRRVGVQLAISHFARDAADGDATVLPLGVANRDAVQATEPVGLVVQRLQPEKATDLAISAWERSVAARNGWQLRIVGDGDERPRLEAQAARTGLDIRFLGYRADVDDLRRFAGLGIATAPREPLGLAVIEGMAQGLPVVAAAAGGHLETVGEARPDLLFPPGEVAACAAAIDRLAASVALRQEIGAELRSYQQTHLSLQTHVDRLIDVYHGVVGDRRRGVRSG